MDKTINNNEKMIEVISYKSCSYTCNVERSKTSFCQIVYEERIIIETKRIRWDNLKNFPTVC
jgi:hypothetical protein